MRFEAVRRACEEAPDGNRRRPEGSPVIDQGGPVSCMKSENDEKGRALPFFIYRQI